MVNIKGPDEASASVVVICRSRRLSRSGRYMWFLAIQPTHSGDIAEARDINR